MIKYNYIEKYKQLNREYRTIGKINKLSNNVLRDTKTYYNFRKENIEITNHAIERYHERANYYDEVNKRNIKHYNKITIVV